MPYDQAQAVIGSTKMEMLYLTSKIRVLKTYIDSSSPQRSSAQHHQCSLFGPKFKEGLSVRGESASVRLGDDPHEEDILVSNRILMAR
jgi:hypothetical protein